VDGQGLSSSQIQLEESTSKIQILKANAESYDEAGDFDKALNTYYRILGYYQENQDHENVVKTLLEIATLLKDQSKVEKALLHQFQALKIINSEAPGSVMKAKVFYDIARVYHDDGDLDHAIEYWRYAVPIFESFQKSFEVAMTNRYIGYAYRDLDMNDKALHFLKLALPTFKDHENPLYAANTADAIGSVYLAMEEYDSALQFFEQSLALYNKSNDPYDHLTTLLSMAICLDKLGEDDKAIAVYLRASFIIVQNPNMVYEFTLIEIPDEFLNTTQLNNIIERRIDELEQKLADETDLQHLTKHKLEYANLLKIKGLRKETVEIYDELHENYHAEFSATEQAEIHQNLGLLLFDLEQYEKSLASFKQAKTLYGQLSKENDAIYSTIGICDVYVAVGEPDKALKTLQEIQFDEMSGALLKSHVFSSLGQIYQSKGILERSLQMFLKSLDLIERTSNPLHEAKNLQHIADILYLMGDYDDAEEKYKRALKKFDLMIPTVEKASTLTGLGNLYNKLGDSKQAFKLYQEALNLHKGQNIEATYTLNNITDLHLNRREYDLAVKTAMESLDILLDNSNTFLRAEPLVKLGQIYYIKKRYEKAYEFTAEAVELWAESPNPHEIKKGLDLMYQYQPQKALALGLNYALGCNWVIGRFQPQIIDGSYKDPVIWKYLKLATSNLWSEVEQLKKLGSLDRSVFNTNWKLEHYLQGSTRKISPETLVNFLFGANDQTYDTAIDGSLRDTQTDIEPMWFIETPAFLYHGQEFLKIRLNNLVKSLGDYVSIPHAETKNPPIKRIKLQMETQWLQKMKVDHLFYPNTDEEYRKHSRSPKDTWLSDIVVMELGNNTKQVDKVELTFNIEIYYDDDDEEADLLSTTRSRSIPVVRKNNYQRVEKYKEKHNNLLALLLASWSIILSIGSFALDRNLAQFLPFVRSNLLFFEIPVLATILFTIFLLLWLRHPVDDSDKTIKFNGIGIERPNYQFNLDEIEKEMEAVKYKL